jgi:ribose transport system permease protein
MSTNNVNDTNLLQQKERAVAAERARRADHIRRLLQSSGIGIPFVLVIGVALVVVPNFTSSSNLTNLLVNSAILALVGFGMTVVIAVRGIDLSVGSAEALVACVVAATVNDLGGVAGVAIGILLGMLLGLFNGVMVTRFKIPGFIATLASLTMFRGAVLLFTNGAPISISSAGFKQITTSSLGVLPVPFIIAALIGGIFWFVLQKSKTGKYVIAVGDNPEAAVESGIGVNRIILGAYMVSGMAAGIAGVLLSSQLGVVNGSVSEGLELQAIAIVVLGGTSMAGGRPKIVGTFIAALVLSAINSSLNLLNVMSAYQYIALGLLLIVALSIDSGQRAAVKRMLEGRN